MDKNTIEGGVLLFRVLYSVYYAYAMIGKYIRLIICVGVVYIMTVRVRVMESHDYKFLSEGDTVRIDTLVHMTYTSETLYSNAFL